MEEEYYLTKEGLKKARRELRELKKRRLEMIRQKMPESLDYHEADAEYTKKREDMGWLESKIAELEHILENYKLIQVPPKKQRNKIHVGAKVSVEFAGAIEEFVIVGTMEADPANNKVSVRSPVGMALLGKKVGEIVIIKTPVVEHKCRVLKIRYEKD